MKNILLLTFLSSFFSISLVAQSNNIDSLKTALSRANDDTNRVNLYITISRYYSYKYPDTVLNYATEGLELARKLSFKTGEIRLLIWIGEALNTKGYFPKALEIKLQALQKAEDLRDSVLMSYCYNYLGALYVKTEDFQKAKYYYLKASANRDYFRENKKVVFGGIGRCFYQMNEIDSAYYYIKASYEIDLKDKIHWSVPYYFMAAISNKKGNAVQALAFYKAGNNIVPPGALDILVGYSGMASVFEKINQQDSAIYYAKKTVDGGLKRSLFTVVLDASKILTNIYKANHVIDSSFKYQEILLAAKDSLFSQDKVKLVLNLSFNEQQRQQQLEQARQEARQQFETQVKLYSLVAGIAVLLLIAFILYRNNRHKQKLNNLLEQQKKEIQVQRDNLEQTVTELKSTQTQLIQSEKMASLGELTAGIAHEIQNPLNFINNFSEVNTELIGELAEEADKGNIDEVRAIVNDIKENEQKINHHGKRADAIVKGMLQHSRLSTGQKELTDINLLADEYLRLGYHGFRARDKSFNATLQTDFDQHIEKINIIPQDIGRVLLNLLNNAFYSVSEKKKKIENYQPKVSVTTRSIKSTVAGSRIEIRIKDNGTDIPRKVVEKIFQPFFTTKPTGEGTGLGLSLAYDIVTKEHGGQLRVDNSEGEGVEFLIELPVK